MTWSWLPVPRGQLVAVQAENARLTALLERLLDHDHRIERKANGLSELPPDKKMSDAMPLSLRRLIGGYRSPATRSAKTREAFERRAQGETWDSIEAEFHKEIHGDDDDV